MASQAILAAYIEPGPRDQEKTVASVYQRHEFAAERRKALEAWAAHVAEAEAGGNVVPLRRA